MIEIIAFCILLAPALLLASPVIADAMAGLKGRGGQQRPRGRPAAEPEGPSHLPRLLFLVPAHDEETLIQRTVRSLLGQTYPRERMHLLVVADNCADRTAQLAREAGAHVLERTCEDKLGKHHAIEWALDQVDLEAHAAVVIVDADTMVDPDYASRIASHAPLEEMLIQTRVGASNEDENWLTRLSAVLTRSRWDLALHLKEGAGLNCPLTGDGTVLGTSVLQAHPWEIETVTEGWELYARFTLQGLESVYEPRARIYAQEARSLDQSRSQRERWTAGRSAVLKKYAGDILLRPGIGLLQRLDLIAELSSVGPVMRAFLGVVGAAAANLVVREPWMVAALSTLFLSPLIQSALYAAIAVAQGPQPGRTAAAFLRLPMYVGWRVLVGIGVFFESGADRWVRTARHEEA